ncbi:hypothetical protein L2E82_33214 [Cichorium intybus]|uniref:Uncharacterized protein n=1 Tax=Cichorium intybus TaxID=13427 RepID=A0ACB9BJK4_CICIN|nr:hypothetical protein L2E82_33214 [Cichorium intybus]
MQTDAGDAWWNIGSSTKTTPPTVSNAPQRIRRCLFLVGVAAVFAIMDLDCLACDQYLSNMSFGRRPNIGSVSNGGRCELIVDTVLEEVNTCDLCIIRCGFMQMTPYMIL